MYDSAIARLRYRADVRLRWSAIVARLKKQKSESGQARKVRVTFTVDLDLYRRFRVTAAQLDMTESQLQELLMAQNVGSAHARGINEKLAAAAGQGGQVPDNSGQAVVAIPGIMNRISQIHQNATAPVDSALAALSTNQP